MGATQETHSLTHSLSHSLKEVVTKTKTRREKKLPHIWSRNSLCGSLIAVTAGARGSRLKRLFLISQQKKRREEEKPKKKYVLNKPLMVMAVNKKQKALIWLENG